MDMKGILLLILVLVFCSGCLANVGRKQQIAQKEGILVVEAEQAPYGKYLLETADFQIWFYDDFYTVFYRDTKVIRDYKTIDNQGK